MNTGVGVVLVALVGAAAFALGGAARGAGMSLASALALLAAFEAVRAARARPSSTDRALVIVAALALVPIGVGALELVPLPRGAVRALAPATADLYDREDAAARSAPSARPLAVEPGTSRRAVERGLAFVAAFVVAARLARSGRAARAMALALVALAAVVALFGTASALRPDAAWSSRAHEPFWNPNHYAGFLALALPVAIGVALGRSDRASPHPPAAGLGAVLTDPAVARPVFAVAASAVVGIGLLRSQSRAGAAAACTGALAALALGRATTRGRVVAGAAALVVLLFAASWINASAVAGRLASSTEHASSRLAYWGLGVDVLRGRALTGGGLGSYDALSFAHLTSDVVARSGAFRPERAHNDWLNLATDVGIPAALAGAAAVLVALGVVARRLAAAHGRRRALAAGALGGAVAALAHAAFDFALEIPAVAAAFATTLGVAWGCVDGPPEEPSRADRPSAVRPGPLVLAVLASVLALVAGRDAVAERLTAELEALDRRLAREEVAPISSGDALALLARTRTGRALVDDDLAVREAEARLLRRAGRWSDALEPARAAARLAPARARTQSLVAIALLDAAVEEREPARADELRAEGERRLALAVSLGPFYPWLHLTAGIYWLDRAAATNQREHVQRAREFLERAIAQDPAHRAIATARVEAHLREGRLAPFADELRAAFAAPAASGKNP